MNRRDFLRSGILASASLSIPGVFGNTFARSSVTAPPTYDLVAIKGGEPETMFDEAIKHLGGLKTFVKKNQKVLVKPNIGWDTSPERAANTNPKLVARVIKHCFDAGAKEVYVFDHTCDDWKRSYSNSGIEKAAKDAGAAVVPGNSESYYQEVSINFGKTLTKAKVHELVLDTDVFINMPVCKNHASTKLSLSMKNMMGVVWDRGYWHRNDLNQCIADYCTYTKKPQLNIIDAYAVMKQNGPRGVSVADVVTMKSQIISTDIVAADAAAAKLFGLEPDTIQHIMIADGMKIGKMDLSALKIKRIIL